MNEEPPSPNEAPQPREDPTPPPDPVAQFLEAALLATEEGRPCPIVEWTERFPHLRLDFERAAITASEISLVRTRIGPTFPGYVVEREVGRGGMGVVYLARQSGVNDRRVAIKVLGRSATLQPHALAKFRAEARAIASLKHSAIVSVYDIVESGEQLAYVMEFVEGGSLDALIRALASRATSPPRSIDAVREILDDPFGLIQDPTYVIFVCRLAIALFQALDAVHRDGLLHRDIKPANVLLRRDGSPLLTDFGLAVDSSGEPLAASPSRSGTRSEFSGTLGYAAPEQLRGRALGRRSDIFALGATIYHALALKAPFSGSTTREVLAQMESGVPDLVALNPDVPQDLAAIIAKTMATDPFERYASAGEVAADLERLLRLEPVLARPHTRGYLLRKLIARNRGAALIAAAGVCSLLLGIIGTSIGMWRANQAAARAQSLAAMASENEYAATIQAAAAALAVYDGATAQDRLERIEAPRRGWEWRYLNAQTDQSVGRVDVPGAVPGEVPLIAFSADGDTLYTATRSTVAALDVQSWQVRWRVTPPVAPASTPVALVPDWRNDLFAVFADGSIRAFDPIGSERIAAPPNDHAATDAQWSPTRERLLVLEERDGIPRIRAVDVEGGSPPDLTPLPPGYGQRIAVEPSLRHVLCSGPLGTLCLRYPSMQRFERPRQAGQSVAASNPAGGFFATAGTEGLLVCSSSDNNPWPRPLAGMRPPQTLAWMPGTSALIGGSGRVLSVWEALYGALDQKLIGHRADVRAIAASPDARTVVSVDERGVVLRWCIKPPSLPLAENAQQKAGPHLHPARYTPVPVSANGVRVRISQDDPSVLEAHHEERDHWSQLHLGGPVSALAAPLSEHIIFACVPGIGLHVLRMASDSDSPSLDVSLVLDDAPLNTDELQLDGDTLVARSRGVELKRWRTSPLTPDPITPVHELIAADATYLDNFGNGAHSDGTHIIVGSPGADSTAFDVGSAHIFRRHPTRGWIQQCELFPSLAGTSSQAGRAVAIDGEWAAVGLPGGAAAGQSTNGAVTLFRLQRGCWVEVQTLVPPPGHEFPDFGGRIAMQGGVLAVCSARTWDVWPGARPVTVYREREGRWELLDQLRPPVDSSASSFGQNVDVWQNEIVVSECRAALDGKARVGRVHAFHIDGNAVRWQHAIDPPDIAADMHFGFGVSLRGNRLAVGAPWRPSDKGSGPGRVYLFTKLPGGQWTFERPLEVPGNSTVASLGSWVEVGDDVVAASSIDSTFKGQSQHGVLVVFPLGTESPPQVTAPDQPLTPGAHFGASPVWLGDGFAASADLDGRYMPGLGSMWIFPYPPKRR